MPVQVLDRGHTVNLGTNVVTGQLHVVGLATPYTVSINGAPAVAHVVALGVVDTYGVNGQTVSVTNTTPNPGPPNLTLSW